MSQSSSDSLSDNGTHPIIDALLMRMSELDRYSDDECVIAGRELILLDVVVGERGEFGFIGGNVSALAITTEQYRTIYETEGAAARAYLAGYLGGRR